MGLQYVVAKRIFGFDKDKNVKYVAKSRAGELILISCVPNRPYSWYLQKDGGLSGCRTGGHHVGRNRRWKDCSFRWFRLFRPSFVGRVLIRRLAFQPVTLSVNVFYFSGKAFSQMLGNMSVTKMVVPILIRTIRMEVAMVEDNSNPSGGNDGDQGENPLG